MGAMYPPKADGTIDHDPQGRPQTPPSYLTSLDAIRPVILSLSTLGELLKYRFHLSHVVRSLHVEPNGYVPGYKPDDGTPHWFEMVNATAAQQAEAFLRTKDLWK